MLVTAAAAAGVAVASTRFVRTPPAAPVGQQVFFGHVKTLKRTGARWLLRFDPAWFLSGLTASRAKLEDTGSSDVPNDNYRVEEGHRLLTFIVAPSARVTVLVNEATKGIVSKPITVSQSLAFKPTSPRRWKSAGDSRATIGARDMRPKVLAQPSRSASTSWVSTSSQRVCGSTSTTAVRPARRMAGAAAESSRPAREASARGFSVLPISCAR